MRWMIILSLVLSLTLNGYFVFVAFVFRLTPSKQKDGIEEELSYKCVYNKSIEERIANEDLFYSIWEVLCESTSSIALAPAPDQFYYLIVSKVNHPLGSSYTIPDGQLVAKSAGALSVKAIKSELIVSTTKGDLLEYSNTVYNLQIIFESNPNVRSGLK